MPERYIPQVQELLARLEKIDALFESASIRRDFSEKLNAAAVHTANEANERSEVLVNAFRRVRLMIAIGLLLWTPFVAYGAVWMHEKIRNNCYVVTYNNTHPTNIDGAWYCNLFPGTDHAHHMEM